MLISYTSVRVFVTIRGKICPPQWRNWKMGILHTSKIVSLLPVRLRNNRHLAYHTSEPYAKCKVLWKMVTNCARNRSRPNEIDTETEICTSLKSKFYFRFRRPPSIKSTLIGYISVRLFVTISGKIYPPKSRNWKNRILHTSKIGSLLPVCLRNKRHLADHISEPYAKFYGNGE